MAKDRILIVDDDKNILTMLQKVMKSYDFESVEVTTGEEALDLLAKEKFSLMLLDINLEGINGFEVINKIRDKGDKLPIIVISARQDEYDTLYGIDIGADDYVTKPFNPVVLGAKVKALLRRCGESYNESDNIMKVGPFKFDTSSLRFYKNDVEIVMTSKETAMIKLFMDNINRVFSKEMLYDLIWGNSIVDDNSIMVYVNRLRQKIEDDPNEPKYIQNVRGIGYRFVI